MGYLCPESPGQKGSVQVDKRLKETILWFLE